MSDNKKSVKNSSHAYYGKNKPSSGKGFGKRASGEGATKRKGSTQMQPVAKGVGKKEFGGKTPLLPGGAAPARFFINEISLGGDGTFFPDLSKTTLLILGSGFTMLLPLFEKVGFGSIHAACDDNEEIFGYKANTPKEKQVPVLFVDYASLDHKPESFDFVFCQATLASGYRNKLIKEIKRILKPGGLLITSEVICAKKPAPTFLNDILSGSGQDPLYSDEFESYYTSRKFELLNSADFTDELDEFYITWYKKLENSLKSASSEKRQEIRKEFAGEKHEITTMVKGGALKFLEFKTRILRKL